MKLAGRAHKKFTWKCENRAIRRSSAFMISWAKQKNEFSRGAMESSTGLTLGQSEWWVKELVRKGVIKRTKRLEAKSGKGQRQVIYEYIK